jgi:hypothetical protein
MLNTVPSHINTNILTPKLAPIFNSFCEVMTFWNMTYMTHAVVDAMKLRSPEMNAKVTKW